MVRRCLPALLFVQALTVSTAGFGQPTWAQAPTVSFEVFSTEEGLSQYSIISAVQDRFGFLWLGTQAGLNRYDGYGFKVYRHDDRDSSSLSDDFILSLYEDRTGILWIGTLAGGLNRYDRDTERFSHIDVDPGDSNGGNAVYAITEDEEGALWLGTGRGLVRYDPRTRILTPIGLFSEDSGAEPTAVRSLAWDVAGTLWVGTTGRGVYRVDPESGRVMYPEISPRARGALHDAVVRALYQDDDMLWVGTLGNGLFRVDATTGVLEPARVQCYPSVFAVIRDRKGRLWLGTDGGGLVRADPSTGACVFYRHDPERPGSLSHDQVFSLLEDRTGVLWVGTWSGLNKLSPLKGVFTHLQDSQGRNALQRHRVVAIRGDLRGAVWIGTMGDGLLRYDPANGHIDYFNHDPFDPASLSHDEVMDVLEDRHGTLWVATLGGGLNVLDPATMRFRHIRHDPADTMSIGDDYVLSIYESRDGLLWAGTRYGGLQQYDPETGRWRRFRYDEQDPQSIGSDHVWPILEDREGVLWVGTFGGGLNALDRAAGRFRRYLNDPEDPNSIGGNRIFSLAEGEDGTLWIGTMGGGLSRLDPDRTSFRTYTVEDGLPHDTVLGILIDEEGDLWLSTNHGLSRFDPVTETFTTYTARDGLQSNTFHVGARWKARDGRLYFGGSNGVSVFDPRRVPRNRRPPPVVLTAFEVFERPVDAGRALETLHAIELSYRENFFAIEFAALDFTAPDRNRYAYKLEGLDGNWIESGTRRFATYTNVPPGSYVLRVEACNSDGVWNEDGLILSIHIAPPFWKTTWFLLLSVVFAGTLLTAAYRYRVRKLLEVERMRMRIAGRLHDDLGANLSSIAINSEMALSRGRLDEVGIRQLNEISRTARSTAHELREMVWVVNAEYDTLDKLLSKLEDVTVFMLDEYVPYTFKRPPQVPDRPLSMDVRQNIYFLYKEALHNVVKHARACRVDVEVKLRHGLLSIRVTDDGVGFIPEEVKEGNGLRLMQQRAADAGGHLTITSAPGKGTTIVLTRRLSEGHVFSFRHDP